MKFVDEATMKVQAGNGGRGCVSFRRGEVRPLRRAGWRRWRPSAAGSVFLRAKDGINTLADFRIQRTFKARNGEGRLG